MIEGILTTPVFEKAVSLALLTRRSHRRGVILRNMLSLELRTNLSLLEKVLLLPNAGKSKTPKTASLNSDNEDPNIDVTEKKFLGSFLNLLKVDALIGILTLVGEGEGIRYQFETFRQERGEFDTLAMNAIRKYQTLRALVDMPQKFSTKTKFSVRLNNFIET